MTPYFYYFYHVLIYKERGYGMYKRGVAPQASVYLTWPEVSEK